jgi:hypothetical protein
VTLAALVPEEWKTNEPEQVVPRAKSLLSPGANVCAFTVVRLFQGLLSEPSPFVGTEQST